MKPLLFALVALTLASCAKTGPETVEADLKAAVAKAFDPRDELIFFVPALGKGAWCGMAGRSATREEPFERPKAFLYESGQISKFTGSEKERAAVAARCEGKVPMMTPALEP